MTSDQPFPRQALLESLSRAYPACMLFADGTFIGATYAELFPEHVGRFVLDGAVDPLLNAFDTLLVQMEGFENGFRAYMVARTPRTYGYSPGTVSSQGIPAESWGK